MIKLFGYILVLLVSLMLISSISWNSHSDKALKTYAFWVKKVNDKRRSILNQSCYEKKDLIVELNDHAYEYFSESFNNGIGKALRSTGEIRRNYQKGKLTFIQNSESYFLDTMWYSYAFLTPSSSDLLNDIGKRFQFKLENTSLECSRFVITSILRTENSIKRLRRWNRNAIKNSSHLHGTSFDISYRSFLSNKTLNEAESAYLKSKLIEAVWELRSEGRCWVTYETRQTCLHIVCRD